MKRLSVLEKQIKQVLKRNADKRVSQKNKIYHKYDGHRTLGISAPMLDRSLKSFRKEIKGLNFQETVFLAMRFYRTGIEEMILTGNFILQTNSKLLDHAVLPFLDCALDYFCSWSTVDDFCIDVLQPVLFAYPRETLNLLKKWNLSKNMWKRRASVVTFVRRAGKSGKFTGKALTFCNHLIHDPEDLVRKGVGWCLKDVMRGDKKRVFEYVKKLRRQDVSSTIVLYAIRDLKGSEREAFLRL